MIVFGVKISTKKQVQHALTAIYGLGLKSSLEICKQLNIPYNTKVDKLTDLQIANIIKLIKKNYLIEDNLRKQKQLNISKLVKTKSYKGFRHMYSLPLRGQRTSTNGKTQKRLNRFRFIK